MHDGMCLFISSTNTLRSSLEGESLSIKIAATQASGEESAIERKICRNRERRQKESSGRADARNPQVGTCVCDAVGVESLTAFLSFVYDSIKLNNRKMKWRINPKEKPSVLLLDPMGRSST